MLQIGIYVITHVLTGRFYIGSTGNYPQRKSQHLTLLNSNSHNAAKLQEAFNSDPDLTWFFWPTTDRLTAAQSEMERLSAHWGEPLLCNTFLSSKHGLREKSPELRRHLATLATGRLHSKETKEQMSLRRRGRPKSPEWSAKIAAASAKAIIIDGISYPSMTSAARELDLQIGCVAARIKSNSSRFTNWQLV